MKRRTRDCGNLLLEGYRDRPRRAHTHTDKRTQREPSGLAAGGTQPSSLAVSRLTVYTVEDAGARGAPPRVEQVHDLWRGTPKHLEYTGGHGVALRPSRRVLVSDLLALAWRAGAVLAKAA